MQRHFTSDEESLRIRENLPMSTSTTFKESELAILRSINEYQEESEINDPRRFEGYAAWYIRYIEYRIHQYTSSQHTAFILSRIYPENTQNKEEYHEILGPETRRERILESLGKTCEVLKTRDSSMKAISDKLGNMKAVLDDNSTQSACCHHIFTMISWITMLYSTTSPQPEGRLQLSLKDTSKPEKRLRSLAWKVSSCAINPDIISQPFPYILQAFGDFIPTTRFMPKNHTDYTFLADSLVASNLSYYSLIKVGHVRIQWVEAISLHLEFDERTSILKLFRYPSFCAMLCLGRDSNSTIFSHIFSGDSNASINSENSGSFEIEEETRAAEPYSQDFFAEILYSYRLLFGQHKRSRSEFRKIKTLQNETCFNDPLLQRLCSLPAEQESLYTEIDAPRIKTLYSARADFPFFGRRLLVLHEYMNTQNPSDLKTLWYDRRDVLRFYTFWAVFGIGGISILLSIVQIVIACLAL